MEHTNDICTSKQKINKTQGTLGQSSCLILSPLEYEQHNIIKTKELCILASFVALAYFNYVCMCMRK